MSEQSAQFQKQLVLLVTFCGYSICGTLIVCVLTKILLNIKFFVFSVKLPPDVLVSLLIKMADAEARLASGCSERIELAALIAAFQITRDQVSVGNTETPP